MPANRKTLLKIYHKLYNAFGPQHWWPGDTPFEIIVGAILTQNTNWQNVEKAINNLKKNKCLNPFNLKKISTKKLAQLIRPSGYYNIKAHRLKEFIIFLHSEYNGKLASMAKEKLGVLRKKLLNIKGIGPETADSILLYAFNKPIFVVDAYTKRVLARHNIYNHNPTYYEIQESFMKNLPRRTKLFNEYHALFVRLGKEYCKKTARCAGCPLEKPYFTSAVEH